jgi:regulator of ribosome biosynthesis
MAQALVARLFSLPAEPVPGGRVVALPAPLTHLPREKPLPKPKPLTKWQKFAQEKGIRKRKRSKLVFDEDQQEWRRRHGKGRAGDANDLFAVEAKSGVDDSTGAEDPFSRMAREKKERVRANERRQAANLVRAAGGKVTRTGRNEAAAGALPATVRLSAAADVERHRGGGRGKPVLKKELKEDLRAANRLAGVSTASMGKFDRRLKGEKDGERSLLARRKKALGVTDVGAERQVMRGAADKFLRERATDVLDVQRAITRLESEGREERRAANNKKRAEGGGKGGGDRKGLKASGGGVRKGGKGGKGKR